MKPVYIGSIFIQELCKMLNERGTKDDLGTISTYVNRNIMDKYSVQAPEIVNQLGNFVFFKGIKCFSPTYHKM